MRNSGRKPTREERKYIEGAGLDTWVWLVQKNTTDFMQVINKETNEEFTIDNSTIEI